jgi:hypothetical protein
LRRDGRIRAHGHRGGGEHTAGGLQYASPTGGTDPCARSLADYPQQSAGKCGARG